MPNPTLSAAMQEAYASADPGTPIIGTLAVYYSGLVDDDDVESDLFLFTGNNPTSVTEAGIALLQAKLEAGAPRKAGQVVTFTGVPFTITLPGVTTDPIPRAVLTIDNVKQEMIDLLILAAQGGQAIEVTYREYLAGSELDGPENDPPMVFNFVEVTAPGTQVTGRLVPLAIGNRRFPFETYKPSRFKTLQYA